MPQTVIKEVDQEMLPLTAEEVERLRGEGVRFRSDIISGPGGQQIVLDDPSGNPIELFQPAAQ